MSGRRRKQRAFGRERIKIGCFYIRVASASQGIGIVLIGNNKDDVFYENGPFFDSEPDPRTCLMPMTSSCFAYSTKPFGRPEKPPNGCSVEVSAVSKDAKKARF